MTTVVGNATVPRGTSLRLWPRPIQVQRYSRRDRCVEHLPPEIAGCSGRTLPVLSLIVLRHLRHKAPHLHHLVSFARHLETSRGPRTRSRPCFTATQRSESRVWRTHCKTSFLFQGCLHNKRRIHFTHIQPEPQRHASHDLLPIGHETRSSYRRLLCKQACKRKEVLQCVRPTLLSLSPKWSLRCREAWPGRLRVRGPLLLDRDGSRCRANATRWGRRELE